MPLERIVPALAAIERTVMRAATVHEEMPYALDPLPAVLNWTGKGAETHRDVLLVWWHTIDVRVIFSKSDQPASDAEARSWIEPFRRALERDPTLGGAAHNSRLAGYTYGLVRFAGTEYLGFSLTVEVEDLLPSGEVEDRATEEVT